MYSCSSRKVDDIIHNFIKKVIVPLIDYINIELSKKLLEYDEFYPNITFTGDNSPVYFQSSGNQMVTYNNDLKDINALIDTIINFVNQIEDNDLIDKLELKDDITIIKESINSKEPNISRIKRLFSKISSTISSVSVSVGGILIISEKLKELWQLLEPLF